MHKHNLIDTIHFFIVKYPFNNAGLPAQEQSTSALMTLIKKEKIKPLTFYRPTSI